MNKQKFKFIVFFNIFCLFSFGQIWADDEQKIRQLKERIKETPENANLYFQLGWHYHKMSLLNQAKDYYEQAIALKPNFPAAWVNLGNIYKERKNIKSAENSYAQALKYQADFVDGHYNMGALHLSLNQLEQAKKSFEMTLRYDKKHVSAMLNLSNIHLRYYNQKNNKQDIAMAEDYLSEILRITKEHGPAYFNLGKLYEQKNDIQNAINFYEEAQRYLPRNSRHRQLALERTVILKERLKKKN